MSFIDTKRIELTAKDTAETAVAQIKAEPAPLIVLLADHDAALDPTVTSLCSRAIFPAALDSNTIIIDNGPSRGCIALAGQAARDEGQGPLIIYVQPHPPGSSDSGYPVHIQLPPEWPNRIKAVFQIAAGLVKVDRKSIDKPAMTVLIGGGKAEKEGLIRSVRRGWPILLMEGSGGVADEVLNAMKPATDGTPAPPSADPEIREIIETASIDSFLISGNADDLHRILMARVDQRVNTLADSWRRFDDLDAEAFHKHELSRRLQAVILILGVVATLLAILQSGKVTSLFPDSLSQYGAVARGLAHFLMVLTPITISILVAASSRFREGNKWVLLRASAEAVKREIFRYRMKAGQYSDDQCGQLSRESRMAEKLKDISSSLAQSEVNRTSVSSVSREDPARLTFLEPDEYLKIRLDDQINYFQTKTRQLYRRLKKIQIWIYVVGGTGTLLAAFNGDVWVALTTAIASAFATRLEMDQVENTLVQYNQALTSLRNIKSWWEALSHWEQKRRRNINLLVEQTEKALEGEMSGWIQQLQSTLDRLTERQESEHQTGNANAARAANG